MTGQGAGGSENKRGGKVFPVTAQMIVKNEERWIWFAVQSVLPWVCRFLIYDTGSTDRTVEVVRKIRSSKIVLEEKGETDRRGLVELRREQLERTKTEWFLLVDGDEVWPEHSIQGMVRMMGEAGEEVMGIVCRTRNCVGNVWHYLPESEGEYRFFGRRGHFNLRGFRKVPGLSVEGEYPSEVYMYKGEPLNEQEKCLNLLDDWYLHVSHLARSSRWGEAKVVDRLRKFKWGRGVEMAKSELPGVLFFERPREVGDPFEEMTKREWLARMGWSLWDKLFGRLKNII